MATSTCNLLYHFHIAGYTIDRWMPSDQAARSLGRNVEDCIKVTYWHFNGTLVTVYVADGYRA